MKLLRAAWLATMDAPLRRDGAVVLRGGRIAAAGDAASLLREWPGVVAEDLGGAILLPGLVNAHTHLELSALSRPAASGSFAEWLLKLVPRQPMTPQSVEDLVSRSVLLGVEQCLRFGITSVGDISRNCALSRQHLSGTPLRIVSYGEIQAMAQNRGFLESRIEAAVDSSFATDRLRIAISPHAPYSIEPEGYRRCLQTARARALPLATHLAESPDEAEFLGRHAGPLRDLWAALGRWDDAVPFFEGGAVRFARELGLLDYPTLLAHVNYCDDDELALLAQGRASVVYCPRTHAYFRHPPHRWLEMLDRGINVAIGTDSCVSSPDLNLVEELRLVHRDSPEIPAETLWKMATINGARAIEAAGATGTLTPGKAADCVAFAVGSEEPLKEILEREILPAAMWIGGERVSGD